MVIKSIWPLLEFTVKIRFWIGAEVLLRFTTTQNISSSGHIGTDLGVVPIIVEEAAGLVLSLLLLTEVEIPLPGHVLVVVVIGEHLATMWAPVSRSPRPPNSLVVF